jgi:hypothetical protein
MVEQLGMADAVIRFDDEVERMKREILPGRSRPPKFAREIQLFKKAQMVMTESRDILAGPDTGRRAIAAETEAIELLLQSQFGGGNGGGGGGGGSPGGGSTGGTRNAALARLGEGVDELLRVGFGFKATPVLAGVGLADLAHAGAKVVILGNISQLHRLFVSFIRNRGRRIRGKGCGRPRAEAPQSCR